MLHDISVMSHACCMELVIRVAEESVEQLRGSWGVHPLADAGHGVAERFVVWGWAGAGGAGTHCA